MREHGPRSRASTGHRKGDPFSSALGHLALGLGGFLAGAAALTVQQVDPAAHRGHVHGETYVETIRFISSVQFESWLFLTAALVASCFVFAAVVLRALLQSWRVTTLKAHELAVGLAMLSVPILVIQAALETDSPLYQHHLRITLLVACVGVVGVSCLAGLLMTGRVTQSKVEPIFSGQIDHLQRQQESLRVYLTIAGMIIGFGTLARGALREALIAAGQPVTNLERTEVIVYGLYLSLVLAAAYVPARLAIRMQVRNVLAVHFPMPDDPSEVSAWYARRSAVSGLLRADADILEELVGGVAILGPLAGSGGSLLLGA